MVHGLLALWYCIFSTQTLVVVGAILRQFIIYITEHLQHLNYFVEYVWKVERSLSRTRVVLIYLTVFDEDDGVVYLYHCDL